MQNKYDCAIIGDGPAGLSAAVNLLQRGIQPVVFGVGGSLLQKAERVDNYLGLPAMDGQAMYAAFLRHAADSGAELRRVKVNNIMPLGGNFIINAGGDLPEARTVILATGAAKARAVPGEAELLGMGVSYCATCDGMLYRGKKTVVWALCAEAWQEAEFLQSIGCEVTVIAPRPAEAKYAALPFIQGAVQRINGQTKVQSVTAGGQEIAADGVFILREAIAPAALVPGLAVQNGSIVTNADGETNIRNIFAAGDATGKPLQIAKAVAEGQRAALFIAENRL